jgi:phosphoribosylamine--glycine ligase
VKVLILGGGGREHALAWRLSKSPAVKQIIVCPGNPGIAQVATCIPAPQDVSAYPDVAEAYGVDLTIVGPEGPLVVGVADQFHARRLKIIGPTRAAARLEGSKIFTKQFCERTGIPTARSVQATTYDGAREAAKKFALPVVIKADGLAAGKGVTIAQNDQEANEAIERLGPDLVIEEFLQGEEVSFIGISNGRIFLPFAPSQDHKRVFDGDKGPNTGGMGAYCDARILTPEQSGEIMDRIVEPTLAHMRKEGNPFLGFLYAGLMMTADGPKLLEYNVRLGDPEAQALLHSFSGDFAEILSMIVSGTGEVFGNSWATPSVCVVLAAEGYPERPRTGDAITGIEDAEATGAVVFHAGTRRKDGTLETSAGRVLGVTAGARSLELAIERAYEAVSKIRFEGMHYRRDIGKKGLKRWVEAGLEAERKG